MKYLFFILVSFLQYGCNKVPDPDISNYPKGFIAKDSTSSQDCSMSKCSNERIVRFKAENVLGVIIYDNLTSEYALDFTKSFDSSLRLYFCELPSQYRKDSLNIEFSGDIIDACGVYSSNGPVEEIYIINNYKISIK